jgi:hypothetical protein
MPFQFPDPNVQTEVVHPVTGETWHYHEGAWEVEDSQSDPVIPSTHSHPTTHAAKAIEQEVNENEEQLQAVSTTLLNLVNKVDALETLDLDNALSALATAQADIIELKSKVNALELTSFLIME